MGLSSIAAKLIRTLKTDGPSGVSASLRHALRNARQRRRYTRWIEANRITPALRAELSSRCASFQRHTKFSIILPVYNVDEKWLRSCIESVLKQIYPTWELCIADDASTEPHVSRVLNEYRGRDERVKIVFRPENGHISAASNSALELAEGEFVVLLDHDDELSEDALYWVAKELNENPDAVVIYSDEDLIDESGHRSRPKFKPDFSRDLFYSFNMLTHLSAFETATVKRVGGFRSGFEGSQDYDLALRVVETIREDQIRHIPRVLYHWRAIRGSVAFAMSEKPYAHERARMALREHLTRTGVSGEVRESSHDLHRVSYKASEPISISIIVGSGDVAASLGQEPALEVIIASSIRAHDLNLAAERSAADVLIFLDNGVAFEDADGASELASFAMQPGIGAVAGRILTVNGFVDEAGIVLGPEPGRSGLHLVPWRGHRGIPRSAPGNMSRNRQVSNFSAISISCLAVRRELFETLRGFDAENFPEAFFDFDFCLRLRDTGKRIVVLPHVDAVRSHRIDRRDHPSEAATFQQLWSKYIRRDPFCNPNLKRDGSFEIL